MCSDIYRDQLLVGNQLLHFIISMLLPDSEELPVFDVCDSESANSFFQKYGIVLVRVLDDAECMDLVLEQWTEVIGRQPWKEYQIRVRSEGL